MVKLLLCLTTPSSLLLPATHGGREENIPEEATQTPVKISGYIYFYGFTTSRQVQGFSNDTVIYFPDKYKCDPNGDDIDAKGEFDLYGLASALRFEATGPDIWCGKSSAYLEGDFNGGITTRTALTFAANAFRIKRGYGKIIWDDASVLIGQHYHPLGMDDFYPDVVSQSLGSPFDPFIYSPQIRVRHTAGQLEGMGVITAHTTEQSRNSGCPNFYGQIVLNRGESQYGVGLDYYQLLPRLETVKGYAERTQLHCKTAHVFADIKETPLELKTRIIYSENGDEYGMIGGYGVWKYNQETDERWYTPLRCISWWGECIYQSEDKSQQAGLFMGYIKNIGARCPLILATTIDNVPVSLITSTFPDVDASFRISPRVALTFEKVFTIYAEVEMTHTWYGYVPKGSIITDALTCTGTIKNPQPITNLSLIVATQYNF